MDRETVAHICEIADFIIVHGMTDDLRELRDAFEIGELSLYELIVALRSLPLRRRGEAYRRVFRRRLS